MLLWGLKAFVITLVSLPNFYAEAAKIQRRPLGHHDPKRTAKPTHVGRRALYHRPDVPNPPKVPWQLMKKNALDHMINNSTHKSRSKRALSHADLPSTTTPEPVMHETGVDPIEVHAVDTGSEMSASGSIEGHVADVFHCTAQMSKGAKCPLLQAHHRGYLGTLEATIPGVQRSRRAIIAREYAKQYGSDAVQKPLLPSKSQSTPKTKAVYEADKLKQKFGIKAADEKYASKLDTLASEILNKSLLTDRADDDINVTLTLILTNIQEFDSETNKAVYTIEYELLWLDPNLYYNAGKTPCSANSYQPCARIDSWDNLQDSVPFNVSDAAPSGGQIWVSQCLPSGAMIPKVPSLEILNQIDKTLDETKSALYRAEVYNLAFSWIYKYNVKWRRSRMVETLCVQSEYGFPFEETVCSLAMSIGNVPNMVNLSKARAYVLTSNYRLHFNVTNNQSVHANMSDPVTKEALDRTSSFLPLHGSHSDALAVEFGFTIRRAGMIIITVVILPVVEMLAIGYMAFFMDIRSVDRINMAITLILPLYLLIAETLSFRKYCEDINPVHYLLIISGVIAIYTVIHTTLLARHASGKESTKMKRISFLSEKKRRMAFFFNAHKEILLLEQQINEEAKLRHLLNKSPRPGEIKRERMLHVEGAPLLGVFKLEDSEISSGQSSVQESYTIDHMRLNTPRIGSVCSDAGVHQTGLSNTRLTNETAFLQQKDLIENPTNARSELLRAYESNKSEYHWYNALKRIKLMFVLQQFNFREMLHLKERFNNEITEKEKARQTAAHILSMAELAKNQSKSNVNWSQWRDADFKRMHVLAIDAALEQHEENLSGMMDNPAERRLANREDDLAQIDYRNMSLTMALKMMVRFSNETNNSDIHLLNPVPQSLNNMTDRSESIDQILKLIYPCFVLCLISVVNNMENANIVAVLAAAPDSAIIMGKIFCVVAIFVVLWLSSILRQMAFYRSRLFSMTDSIKNHFIPFALAYHEMRPVEDSESFESSLSSVVLMKTNSADCALQFVLPPDLSSLSSSTKMGDLYTPQIEVTPP